MGEKIDFPTKGERFVYLGMKSYEQEDYLKAIHYFEQAYQLKQDVTVNKNLVLSFLAIDEYEKAYQMMKEFDKSYRTDKNLQDVYFDVLLKQRYFLLIEKWLHQLDTSNESGSRYREMLSTTQDYWTKINNKDYLKHIENCETIAAELVVNQKERLKEFNYLTKEDFINIVTTRLLTEKNLSILIQSQLIDDLIQLGVTQEIEVIDLFNHPRYYQLEKINRLFPSIMNHPLYNSLEDYMEKSYPTQAPLVLTILKTHLGMIYPCYNEIIEDVMTWKEAYLCYFGIESEKHDEEIQEIIEQIKVIDTIMMNTMTK